MGDKRLNVREVASDVCISSELVRNILHEHWNMKKLFVRRVSRLDIGNQKRNHVTCSNDDLQLF